MYKYKHFAFTLVEVLVSITIFAIIMVSVIMIFSYTSALSNKIDITRAMQENIKNIVETMKNDIVENKIAGVSKLKAASDCNFSLDRGMYRLGDKLCTGTGSIGFEYFLAKKNLTTDMWNRIDSTEIDTECSNVSTNCVLVRYDKANGDITRLSNSLVAFKNLKFYISSTNINKVSIIFTMRPSSMKGISAELIENSKLEFQTTISDRLVKTK